MEGARGAWEEAAGGGPRLSAFEVHPWCSDVVWILIGCHKMMWSAPGVIVRASIQPHSLTKGTLKTFHCIQNKIGVFSGMLEPLCALVCPMPEKLRAENG